MDNSVVIVQGGRMEMEEAIEGINSNEKKKRKKFRRKNVMISIFRGVDLAVCFYKD